MIKEIRDKNTTEIKNTIIKIKARLLEYRLKHSRGDFLTTHLIKECKKTIAQLMTVLTERKEKLNNKDWKEFIAYYQKEQKSINTENVENKNDLSEKKEAEIIADDNATQSSAKKNKNDKKISKKTDIKNKK